MLYDQYFIDDLKGRADIVRIIQPYVQDLKKKGANWMGCCPFHSERTPSFSVNPVKGFYKCFGCGKGGTAFNFIMEMEGVNFPESVRRVAEMSGIPLPEPIDDEAFAKSKKKRDEKKLLADRVIELNQVALDYWAGQLSDDNADAQKAREYLAKRGISDEIVKQFRIGFSPNSWDGLLSVLRDFGADEKLIAESGLVSVNEEKERVYDRFRGRVMFPVLDVDGRPVAFGARSLDPDDQPKYLNSPETPAYTKGDNLYGLFQGKEEIRKRKFAILVEGYLDLIALAQFGITNVAASLGTAFTDEQAKLLGRFTKNVVINYDGDSAGIKAARRAIEHLLPQDFDIKVLTLPDGKDPDDFIRENGTETYNRLRGRATPFLQFALASSVQDRNLGNAKQKAEAIEDFLPVIAKIKNHIQQRESFDQAMEFYSIDDIGLKRELWRTATNSSNYEAPSVVRQMAKASRAKITFAEKELLELLAHDRELREMIIPLLEAGDYINLASSEIYHAFVRITAENEDISPETLISHLDGDEETLEFARNILTGKPRREIDDVIDGVLREAESCVFALRNMAIVDRISDINREALIAQNTGDQTTLHSLINEQIELEKIRRELQTKITAV